MAPQRTLKHVLGSAFNASVRSLAFVPDGSAFQWAVIQESTKGPVLQGFGVDTSVEDALRHIQGLAADRIYTASILPSLATLCRQVPLPSLHPKEVRSALIDTLEQTVSINIEESVVAYEVHDSGEGSMTVTAYLANQAAVKQHLDALATLSIDPEWVIPKAACLAAFLAHFAVPGWQYGIDIGADETTAVLIFNGSIIESRSLVGGSSAFIALAQPSPDNDEQLRRFLQHLTEVLLAFKERFSVEASVPLTITGSVLSLPLASAVIAEFVQAPLSPLHDEPDNISLLQCAAVVGAALLTQPKSSSRPVPNFRAGELAFAHPLLHWKRPLATLCLGCLAAASALAWYGASRSEAIIEQMRHDWKAITVAAHITPEEVARQTEKALGISIPLEKVSPENLLAMGNWLRATVERQTSYPLHPDIPRLSDLISWLSLQISDIAQSAPKEERKFEIQSLHYALVKHPTKAHPKERYQVRVDLEFLTPSVALARAFHERLVSKNAFVDNSAEVKWTPSSGKYRTSFFLKDNTHYPQQTS